MAACISVARENIESSHSRLKQIAIQMSHIIITAMHRNVILRTRGASKAKIIS